MPLVYEAFDLNRDKKIDFRELMHGLSTLCRGDGNERIELAFNCYDTNKSGVLERDEVTCMVTFLLRSRYTFTPSQEVVSEQVETIFRENDLNDDGEIDLNELES